MNKNKIVYGKYIFQDDDFKSGSLFLATSLLSSQLQVNTLESVVKCADPAILDFERNSKLIYYCNGKQRGIFYVQNIQRVAPELYEISSTSTLGLLTEGQHMGGIYTGQTAEEVILDICGTVPVEIKNSLKKIKLYGWLPIAAPRDNLAQVLFAIGAALKTDLDGVLRIEGLWDGISGQVPQNSMYTEAKAGYSARITRVIVTEHQYVPWTEEKQLFEGTAQQGDVITFDAPMHGLTAEGFTILDSGANWAKVSAGSGTLTGLTYIHNTRQVSKDVQEARTPNIKTVEDATLVSLVNSQAVAQRLAEYYRCRETIDAPVVYQGETPGDRLAAYHPFDKMGVSACLESADITLSNTLKAQEKLLVGYVPQQMGDVEYFDYSEEITEDGEWEVPEGVTTISVTCIGGGFGGFSGKYGQAPKRSPSTWSDNRSSGKWTDVWNGHLAGEGGEGGEAGEGGPGGKIYTTVLEVSQGQKFKHVIGKGGKGGAKSASGSNPGKEGAATTFGDVTSDEGTSSPSGYYDTVTGTVYATTGLKGINGGKGGLMEPMQDDKSPYTLGETIVDRDGQTWSPGPMPSAATNAVDEESIAGSQGYGSVTAESARGPGGGPAVGENGQAGTTGSVSASRTGSGSTTYPYTYYANATGGTGGRGGNATAPTKQTSRGSGGYGGNGGGGPGGPGLCGVHKRTNNEYSPKVTMNSRVGYAGTPGSGSDGGEGGDGIILIRYRMPKKAKSGQLVDKNNRMVLDRLGRRIIM